MHTKLITTSNPKQSQIDVLRTLMKNNWENTYTTIHLLAPLDNINTKSPDIKIKELLHEFGELDKDYLKNNIVNLRTGSRRHVGTVWENEKHIKNKSYQPNLVLYKIEKLNETDIVLYLIFRKMDVYNEYCHELESIISYIQSMINKQHKNNTITECITTIYDAYIEPVDQEKAINTINKQKQSIDDKCLNTKKIIHPCVVDGKNIASGWADALKFIRSEGIIHNPDYNISTRRIHLTLRIDDVYNNQVHEMNPLGDMAMKKYKDEMTREYAQWYTSLDVNDKRKFDYCYAAQLFKFGKRDYDTLTDNACNLTKDSDESVGVLWDNDIHVDKYEDQPCWVAYKLKLLDNNNVRVYVTYRSWDIYGGLPANIPAIVDGIQKVFDDNSLNYRISEFIATGLDAHYYQTDEDRVKELTSKYRKCPICKEYKNISTMMPSTKGYTCINCLKG
jgi:thymidylate synthase